MIFLRYLVLCLAIAMSMISCVKEPDGVGTLLHIGDSIPQFEVTTLDGKIINTDFLSQRECVIVFFNTTCPDCQRELPIIQARANAEPEIFFLCISREEGPKDVATYWEAHNLTMPVSAQTDRRVYSLFATQGIPRIYQFNSQGILIEQHYLD